ncbi:MAG: NAD(P)H-binding protein [Gemmatimonadaceae bacterium]
MKNVIFGAGGHVGRAIAREALAGKHDVVGVVRRAAGFRSDNERATVVEGDGAALGVWKSHPACD